MTCSTGMSGGLVEILAGSSDDDASSAFLVGVWEAVLETSRVGSCARVESAGKKSAAARDAQQRVTLERCDWRAGAVGVSITSRFGSDMVLGLPRGCRRQVWRYRGFAIV